MPVVPRVRLGGHGLDRHGVLAQRPLGARVDLVRVRVRVRVRGRVRVTVRVTVRVRVS